MGWFDKAIAAVSPRLALRRAVDRDRLRLFGDNDGLGSNYGPYAGAQSTRTSTPWFISQTNPKFRYASQVAMRSMRDRARTIEKNNEIAEALLSRSTENVVGPKGFQLQATANNPAWSAEKNTAWNTKAESLMNGWFPYADISGLDWIEHQKTVFRSFIRDGDILVIFDAAGYLQGVEADLIVSPSDENIKKNGTVNSILFGVEVDQYNNPIAYWVQPLPTADNKQADPVRIDAQDGVFFANKTRFGQIRGITIFATIFELLDQINGWKIATLMAARIAACFGIAITQNDPQYSNTTTNSAGQTQAEENIEPGMFLRLKKGEAVETINPANPGHNFPQNLTAMVRLAGLPFGMPLELVMLDFSGGSYTKSRAAMQQAYRKFEGWQKQFINGYLKRVYKWRISKFIKAGELEPNPDAWNHKWISEPWPFLDPIKELQAIQMAMDINLETLKDTLQARGKNVNEHVEQRKKELAELGTAGVPVLHSQALMQFVQTPGAMQQTTTTPPVSDPQEDDELPDPDDENENENDDEDPENLDQ